MPVQALAVYCRVRHGGDPADSAALHRVRTYLERAPRPALGIAVLSHTAAIGNKDC